MQYKNINTSLINFISPMKQQSLQKRTKLSLILLLLRLSLLISAVEALGGSSGRSSSRSRSRGRSSSSSSGGGWSQGAITVFLCIIGGIMGMVLILTLCAAAVEKEKKESFFKAVGKRKQNVIDSGKTNSNANNQSRRIIPKMESYDVGYLESGKCYRMVITINFGSTKNLGCRSITGHGNDNDGTFTIEHGLVCEQTGLAYWVQQSKKTSICALVSGKFNFETGTFVGAWRADNNITGSFTSFQRITGQGTEIIDLEAGLHSTPNGR